MEEFPSAHSRVCPSCSAHFLSRENLAPSSRARLYELRNVHYAASTVARNQPFRRWFFGGLLQVFQHCNFYAMKSSLPAFLAVSVAHSAGRLLHATRHGPVPDTVTSNVIPMRKHIVPSSEHRSSVVKPVYRRTADVNHPANLTNVHDVYYIVDIVVGNQTLAVSVDTGSSDTWFVSDYFECVRFWWQGPEYVCILPSLPSSGL